jgi:PAS domain S-box-containing protein
MNKTKIADAKRRRLSNPPVTIVSPRPMRETKNSATSSVKSARTLAPGGRRLHQTAVLDVTKRRRLEQALRDSEALVSEVMKQLPVALGVMDASGHWIISNARMSRIVPDGAPSVVCQRRNRWRLYDEQGSRIPPKNWPSQRALRGEVVTGQEAIFTDDDGRDHWMLVSTAPLRDLTGAIIGATAILRDITERKQVEQELELISRLPAENPSPVLRLQHNRVVNFANSAGESLLQQFGVRVGDIAPKEILEAARRGKRSAELDLFGRTYNIGVAPIKHGDYTNLYFSDISDRKMQERRLAELAHILNLTNDAIVVRDLQDQVTYWNKGAEEIYGFTAAEAVGQVTHDLLQTKHPESIEAIMKKLHRYDRWSGELVHTRKDGRQIIVFSRWSLDRDNRGKPISILESNNDITARKHAEETLREKEAELELITTQTPFMLTRCTRDLRYRYVSRAYATMIGRKPEEIAGKPIVQIIGKRGLKAIWPHIQKVLNGHRVEYEAEAPFPGLGPFWLQGAYVPDRDSKGNVIGWFASITDITARKKAEDMLQKSKHLLEERVRHQTRELRVVNEDLASEMQRRKGLEGEILAVSDREQQRLGQELHDGLCQHLTAVAFMARSMALRLKNHRVVDAADIEKLAELVNKAAIDTRNLSRALHRVDVDAAGLINALQDLVDREIWRTPCRLEVKPSFHINDDAAAAHLYRIAREAVINANKHARSRQIIVRLERSQQEIVLRVIDDGIGFPKDLKPQQGLGYHIMKYRAQLMGGRLEIDSPQGHGTRVSCYVPHNASRSLGGENGDEPADDPAKRSKATVARNRTLRHLARHRAANW